MPIKIQTPVTVKAIEALIKDLETVDPEAAITIRADGTGRTVVNGHRTDFYSVEELVERVNDTVYGSPECQQN